MLVCKTLEVTYNLFCLIIILQLSKFAQLQCPLYILQIYYSHVRIAFWQEISPVAFCSPFLSFFEWNVANNLPYVFIEIKNVYRMQNFFRGKYDVIARYYMNFVIINNATINNLWSWFYIDQIYRCAYIFSEICMINFFSFRQNVPHSLINSCIFVGGRETKTQGVRGNYGRK